MAKKCNQIHIRICEVLGTQLLSHTFTQKHVWALGEKKQKLKHQKHNSACKACSYCPFRLFNESKMITVLARLSATALSVYSMRMKQQRHSHSSWLPPSHYASSKVTVLTKLAEHAMHCVARSQNRRCHYVMNANLLLHADFHLAPTLLAR